MKKNVNRYLCAALAAVMLFGMLPVFHAPVRAASAGQVLDVSLGQGLIGNSGHDADDIFNNFNSSVAGFSKSGNAKVNGGMVTMDDPDKSATFTINISGNDRLKQLAKSPTAQYCVTGWVKSDGGAYHWTIPGHKDYERGHIKVSDSSGYSKSVTASHDSVDDSKKDLDTGWRSLTNLSSITIKVENHFSCDTDGDNWNDDGEATAEVHLYIRDNTCPTLSSYSSSYSATINQHNNKELLMKLGVKDANDPDNYYYDPSEYNSNDAAKASRDWVGLKFNFSKPVTVATPAGGGLSPDNNAYQSLASHDLFTNTAGTGFVGQGESRGLKIIESSAQVNDYLSSISYRYTATYGDFSGNRAIPAGGGIESSSGYSYGSTLLAKINNAGFHDAAGNPLQGVDGSKGANIFDRNENGGYDVIVDAVPPTYSRVGNGAYPDILTDMVLNKNDTVDFIISFSEAVLAKRGWTDANTYLLLDNGGKATFVKKSADGKRWTFRYTIPEGQAAEATLLKVIAVLNVAQGEPNGGSGPVSSGSDFAARSFNFDGRAIVDYVGNVMVERANQDPTKNTKQINSFTGWAGLMVDNTAPDFAFRYLPYGSGTLTHPGNENQWGQAVTVYTSATDPDVRVAKYDPDYSSSNTARPSKGIYRPDNTTGSAGSAVGLIFYTWTRDAQAPDTGANFEAIKRYSLTGQQPATVSGKSYAAAWKNYTLVMANNYQNILPPDEAMTSAGDGAWYLHVWTADMTWDSARQMMQYELAKAQQYRMNGSALYNADTMLQLKMEQVEQYRTSHSGADYDAAWKAVRASVYQQVYTTQFLCWLAKIDPSAADRDQQLQNALQKDDMYSDISMAYACAQATMTQAQYDNTAVWSLDKFNKDDSNWTQDTARILLDNTAPAVGENAFGDVTGSNTASATMSATIGDALSGIDVSTVKYQWVPKGGELGIDWVTPTDDNVTAVTGGLTGAVYGKASVTFTAKTEGHVFESGEYVLYVRCSDTAGNAVTLNSGESTVKVNMNNVIACAFGPEGAGTVYMKDTIPQITVTGMLISKVEYAVTASTARPTEGFAEVTATTSDADTMTYEYTLPQLTVGDGVWYLHVLATGNTGDAQYFRGSYCVDVSAPDLYVNNLGLTEEGVSAKVSVVDALSGPGEKAYYQILTTSQALTADSEGWLEAPEDGMLTVTGEPGVYYVHVKAADKAGNVAVAVSKPFEIKPVSDGPMVLPAYSSQLITVADGYGIANLVLEAANRDNYRYSVSTDGGEKWCNWLPYMSMIRMKLPADYTAAGKLKVKFRAPDGTVGDAIDITADALVESPIWATAEFDSTLKRQSGKALTFLMTLSEDTQYRLSGTEDWKTGNYTVYANGTYSFELKRNDVTAESPFIIEVDLFDDIAPAARLTYSEIAPTNANVLVSVQSDESVYVKSVAVRYVGETADTAAPAKQQYSFSENGTAVFTVCDEAGNETLLTATVMNIFKTPPKIKITEDYHKYKTVGGVASGVTLTVEKQDEGDANFTVVGSDPSYSKEVTQNGTYSFVVRDVTGNVTEVRKTVTNIVRDLPEHTMTYTYAVSGGAVNAARPMKEDVTARATFEKTDDARKLYYGTAPAADGSNELAKDASGKYYVSRTYSEGGKSTMVVSDSLGNLIRIPVTVEGIDRTAPTVTPKAAQAVITPTDKKLSRLTADEIVSLFGGYTATDNAYAAGELQVTVSRSDDIIKAEADKGDLSTPGAYTLIYTVTDPAGNVGRAQQSLIVIPGDGLLVQASGAILSGAMSNTAIVPSNHVTFSIDPQRMQAMFYGDRARKVYNRAMRYDIFYVSGLYREGQLKTIATKLTAEELVSRDYSVSFPKAGWYTIIIRNQERTREYTTFFVSSYRD